MAFAQTDTGVLKSSTESDVLTGTHTFRAIKIVGMTAAGDVALISDGDGNEMVKFTANTTNYPELFPFTITITNPTVTTLDSGEIYFYK